MPAKHLYITGFVQGVFYRDGALKEALRLGLTGWVRNTDDDAVEAHIEGSAEALEEFIDWAKKGPPAARVEKVDVSDAALEGETTFAIVQ